MIRKLTLRAERVFPAIKDNADISEGKEVSCYASAALPGSLLVFVGISDHLCPMERK